MRWKWWAPKYEEPMDRTGPATVYPHRTGAHAPWNASTPSYGHAPLMTPHQQARSELAMRRHR